MSSAMSESHLFCLVFDNLDTFVKTVLKDFPELEHFSIFLMAQLLLQTWGSKSKRLSTIFNATKSPIYRDKCQLAGDQSPSRILC